MVDAASGAALDLSGRFSQKGRFPVAELMATQHCEPFVHTVLEWALSVPPGLWELHPQVQWRR